MHNIFKGSEIKDEDNMKFICRLLLIFSLVSFILAGLFAFSIKSNQNSERNTNTLIPSKPLPLFFDTELNWDALIVINPNRSYPVCETRKVILDARNIYPQLMIRRYTDVHKLALMGKNLKSVCFNNNVIFTGKF